MAPLPKGRNIAVAGGLLVFGLGMASFPWLFKQVSPIKNLQNSDKPLSPSQMQRGLYIQAGQRDMGPDPDWVNGVYQPNLRKKAQAAAPAATAEAAGK